MMGDGDAGGFDHAEGNAVAEEHETGAVEEVARGVVEAVVAHDLQAGIAGGGHGDAVDAVGFTDVGFPIGDIAPGGEIGAGTVEEEIAGVDDFPVFGDDEFREAAEEHGLDAVGDGGGPEDDFGGGKISFEEREHAGRVADVADVHGLPGGAEDDARCARGGGGGADGGDQGGGECGGRGGEKVAAIHG
jgi:hypothetical protein